MKNLYERFKVPLDESGYDLKLIVKEWRRAKIYIKNQIKIADVKPTQI